MLSFLFLHPDLVRTHEAASSTCPVVSTLVEGGCNDPTPTPKAKGNAFKTPPSPPSPLSPPSPTSLKREREKERERERKRERKKAHLSSSPEQPCAVITFSLPPPINALDEAVDTNHQSNGARTKPHAPPEDSTRLARETHAPPPSAGATANSGHSPPSPSNVRRSRRDRLAAVAAVDFSGKPPRRRRRR
ncbi:hypothetical protein F2Q70_00042866 [Brassica cretica]|uniref:Uncharacterized protein n=1 Tax=Brassica cretica TaxID=69181 RepID=A0A8S9KH47_BRACR|nr:hypothetical protein F2Q70_00042866 [Brassica cretica]